MSILGTDPFTGRLQTRVWARGITTTYGYGLAGDLQSVAYSDGTAGITNGFDRLGRKTSVTNGATVSILAYNDQSELLGESYSGGPLSGLTVTNFYDSILRRGTNGLWNGSGWLARTYYGYDNASRFLSVGDGTNSAAYSYVANSALVSQILFTNSGNLRMTTTKSYDYLNRLKSIQNSGTGVSPVSSFSYAYSPANQRTSVTNADNSYWVYQYDSLGQVKSGKKYWNDGTPVAGQQFTYGFDDIGNRTNSAFGGDQTGTNLRPGNYTNNTLNQITGRDVPGYVNILGEATNVASVYVNLQSTYRKTNYFREELPVNNSASALWLSITNLAVLSKNATNDITSTNIGNIFVAQTPETFGYDADGNLTSDGRWTYNWDAENRLTNMVSQSTTPLGSKLQLNFVYDYQGRRVQKTVLTNNGSYIPQYTNNFAYDGWNLIATLNPQSSILQSFEWGLDLSGSLQGAGGIGGLLEISQISNSNIANYFLAYDGNGNVGGLVNAGDGSTAAEYGYGPFGEVIRATGPMAKGNPFRFSTKYQDDESDLLYYGYRYYNASTGRWLSRDPAEEFGGLNIYGFVDNAPIDEVDAIGLAPHLSYGTVEKSAGDCGQFVWRTKWQLSGLIFHKKSKIGGSVVQHLTWTIDIRDANGNRVGPATPAPFWEGWTVNKGQSVTTVIEAGGKYDDEWSYTGAGDGTKGTITITGDASFYEGQSLPPSFTVDPSRPSGDLPSTTTDPGLSGGSGNVGRNLTAKWDCICVKDAKDKKTKLKTK